MRSTRDSQGSADCRVFSHDGTVTSTMAPLATAESTSFKRVYLYVVPSRIFWMMRIF